MQTLSKKFLHEGKQKNGAIDEGRCEAGRAVSVTTAIIITIGEPGHRQEEVHGGRETITRERDPWEGKRGRGRAHVEGLAFGDSPSSV